MFKFQISSWSLSLIFWIEENHIAAVGHIYLIKNNNKGNKNDKKGSILRVVFKSQVIPISALNNSTEQLFQNIQFSGPGEEVCL